MFNLMTCNNFNWNTAPKAEYLILNFLNASSAMTRFDALPGCYHFIYLLPGISLMMSGVGQHAIFVLSVGVPPDIACNFGHTAPSALITPAGISIDLTRSSSERCSACLPCIDRPALMIGREIIFGQNGWNPSKPFVTRRLSNAGF